MGKTNAQRQADFRAQHLNGDCKRINYLISVEAKSALERLSFFYGKPAWEILDEIIRRTENDVLKAIPHQREYFEKPLRRNGAV